MKNDNAGIQKPPQNSPAGTEKRPGRVEILIRDDKEDQNDRHIDAASHDLGPGHA